MQNSCNDPPLKTNKHNTVRIVAAQGCGTPILLCIPLKPPRSNKSRRGTPESTQLHPPLHPTGKMSLPGCPRAGGSFWGCSSPSFSGSPQAAGKGRCVQLRTRSCISVSAEAGGVSRWRRNSLFVPVLQEAGGRKSWGESWGGLSWRLLLFNFIFLPPSRNLCNVPAAPGRLGRP